MDYTVTDMGTQKRIEMAGRFTFADNQKFRKIIGMLSGDASSAIAFDFAGVEFIDSAGLGMMLLFRDECMKRKVALSISGACGQVEKIFKISKFDQIFSTQKAAGGN